MARCALNLAPKRRERASVLVICVVLMAGVGTVLISTADLGQFVVRRQYSAENEARWKLTEDSMKAIVTSKALDASLIVPSTTTVNINGGNASVDVAAGTGSLARMTQLSTTFSAKRFTRTRQSYVGNRKTPSPMWFAFGTPVDLTLTQDITADSDIFLHGDLFTAGNTFNVDGRCYAQGSGFTNPPAASEGFKYGAKPISVSPNNSAYQAAATVSRAGNQNITLLAFLPLGQYQSLLYDAGNVTYDVTYVGKGTSYVNGNATIKKLDRNSASDEALIIVNGNLTIETNRVQAFIFCTGTITYTASANLKIEGAVWTNGLDMGNKKLEIVFDSHFWSDPQWDKRMRVPGQW